MEIKVKLDEERHREVVAKKEELGLASYSELFRRLWDEGGVRLGREGIDRSRDHRPATADTAA